MKPLWLIVFVITIFYLWTNCGNNKFLLGSNEHFVSGTEKMMNQYDQIYPLDDPRYTTPQQKDFQIVLSEHSALDSNMQERRKDIATQMCKVGERCFDTQEYHTLNYKMKSAPDIISTKIDPEMGQLPWAIYDRHESNKVVPGNSTSKEMRADLFDDIILPELFFRRKTINEKF